VQLVSKISNIYVVLMIHQRHGRTDGRTDRRTTCKCNRNSAMRIAR